MVHAAFFHSTSSIFLRFEDNFTGVPRSISLRMPEVSKDGHVTTPDRTLNVRIPKGIRAGQQIRLAGLGGPGLGDAGSGDLYMESANPASPAS